MAKLDPVIGSEQSGTRPVLVLQSSALSPVLRTFIVIPFTSTLYWAKYRYCVRVSAHDGG